MKLLQHHQLSTVGRKLPYFSNKAVAVVGYIGAIALLYNSHCQNSIHISLNIN